jgi:type IV pilus assembly protein PilW
MRNPTRSTPKARRTMEGISLVELMIAMVLGLLVLAGLASLFAGSSAARNEMERSSRQIENGRFAMELLGEDLRMAGFFGELNVAVVPTPAALPDPCSVNVAEWSAAIPIPIQGYDNGVGAPACMPADVKPDTDILVVRRVSTCEAAAAGCEPLVGNAPYIQVSKCSAGEPPENVATPFIMGLQGGANFNLRLRNCAVAAGMRRYYVRMYYISTDNGQGEAIPTLKRLDLNGLTWTQTPLVEGIEELNIEYGIDWAVVPGGTLGDGNPDAYTTDPTNFTAPGCTTCTPANNWFNVVTARVNLLARNIDPSPNYVDTKTYSLGRDANEQEITVAPGGAYRRHAYTGLVRVVNVGQRREKPP